MIGIEMRLRPGSIVCEIIPSARCVLEQVPDSDE
jgi:hypothetical protein